MKRFVLAAASAALAVMPFNSLAQGFQVYQVVDLGTLGGTSSTPYGLNNLGEVVGRSAVVTSAGAHAFLWANGVMTDVHPYGYAGSDAYGMNDKSEVVGMTYAYSRQYAFAWSSGTYTILGAGYAKAINNASEITGYAPFAGAQHTHAFLYRNGNMTDLGALAGDQSVGYDINTYGHVVGNSSDAQNRLHAILWADGQMFDLGGLGGASSASSINDSGEIVGYSRPVGDNNHAVMWRNGEAVDLGKFGGYSSYATGINDHHQVVGWSNTPSSGAYGAFLWQDGTMMNIQDLLLPGSGWRIYQAHGINEAGDIIAYGERDGRFNAVLLVVVPEPSACLALFCGVGGAAIALARRSGRTAPAVGQRCFSPITSLPRFGPRLYRLAPRPETTVVLGSAAEK